MEQDYTKLNSAELLQALDADPKKWAKAFLQITEGKVIDEGLLTDWFSNAIRNALSLQMQTNIQIL